MTDVPVLDSPDGALIDNLVADIIDSANRHVGIASEAIERLTSYPALAARYGDFNLGLDFHGTGGRLLRRDIHRRLLDKGMSLRQIAAQTGASKDTVRRDVSDETPEEGGAVSDETPDEPSDLHEAALPIDPGERGFVALIRGVIRELEEAELVNAGSVTPGKVGVMRDLFDEADRLRDDWMPYLGRSPLREVK